MNKKGGVVEGIVIMMVLISFMFVLVIGSVFFKGEGKVETSLQGELEENLLAREMLLRYASSAACDSFPKGISYADAMVLVVEQLDSSLEYSESFYEPAFVTKIWSNGLEDSLIADWYFCTTAHFQKELPSEWRGAQNSEYNQRFNLIISDSERALINYAGTSRGWDVQASITLSSKKGPLQVVLLSKSESGSGTSIGGKS